MSTISFESVSGGKADKTSVTMQHERRYPDAPRLAANLPGKKKRSKSKGPAKAHLESL